MVGMMSSSVQHLIVTEAPLSERSLGNISFDQSEKATFSSIILGGRVVKNRMRFIVLDGLGVLRHSNRKKVICRKLAVMY